MNKSQPPARRKQGGPEFRDFSDTEKRQERPAVRNGPEFSQITLVMPSGGLYNCAVCWSYFEGRYTGDGPRVRCLFLCSGGLKDSLLSPETGELDDRNCAKGVAPPGEPSPPS